ncbi:MAG TPA: hypothetical protein VFX59_01390 [Polyangiales bacterium]|nr:hypothetical protein [Polyangiales bacterium]
MHDLEQAATDTEASLQAALLRTSQLDFTGVRIEVGVSAGTLACTISARADGQVAADVQLRPAVVCVK